MFLLAFLPLFVQMLHESLKFWLLFRRQNRPDPIPALLAQNFPLHIRRRVNDVNLRFGVVNDRAELLLLFWVQLQVLR